MKIEQHLRRRGRHFAFDGRILSGQRAGKGRYVLGLLQGWSASGSPDRLTIYTNAVLPFDPPLKWELVPAPPSFWGSIWLARDARRRGCQAILAPGNFSLPVVATLPTATVIYDLAVFRSKEARPSWKTSIAEHVFLKLASWRSVHLFAISQFTKDEAVDYLHLQPNKISLAYCASDESFRVFNRKNPADLARLHEVSQKYQLPKTFLLFVGTLEPRKNLVRLLTAYASLKHEDQLAFPLILVGRVGWSAAKIIELVENLGHRGLVRHLNYVPDEDVPVLYNLASAVVYPSIYEGFGLPALEAMASGCPVVTTQTSSLPEVVGEQAVTIDPLSVESIRSGLTKMIGDADLRVRLKKAGPIQAKKFSWLKTVRGIQQVLEKMVPPQFDRIDQL